MTKFKITLGILIIFILGAAGATSLSAPPAMPNEDILVEREVVKVKQLGNEVEAAMPWNGESGLTFKYDMGAPDIEERVKDERKRQVVVEKVLFNNSEGVEIDVLLTEKPATNTFCYTIEGWENYDFFYQPPLNEGQQDPRWAKVTATDAYDKDGKLVDHRPEEIVGSYAIYHKTLKNNSYQTGKFGHIPFPYVWEVNNKEATKQRAQDLTYKDGRLCVVVQQDFLDKATYPVRIDPTIGYTTIGASDSFGVNAVSKFPATEAGTVDAFNCYNVWAGVNYDQIHALYSDSSGTPDALLGESSAGVTVSSTGWKSTTPAATTAFSAGDVWVGYLSSSANTWTKYDSGDANQSDFNNDTYPTWSDPYDHIGGFLARKWSIYIDYTATVSATSTCPISSAGVSICNGQVNINGGTTIIK